MTRDGWIFNGNGLPDASVNPTAERWQLPASGFNPRSGGGPQK
ncbi:hypothetical protein RISK_005151 [Rhodopirellula islandica]|uniref:Uncharacterized protein n=1 Tax=Rhodopirellula islandica TaxID=595434 RepID=A0A0J1B7N5_RHOIS|nr:hypothetical protein RISK_005151 [Rhodopirellula islandica]